jgi:hypothetical protein
MCLSAPKPKIPKPEPIPPAPTKDDPEAVRQAEEQRRKLRMRAGVASTQLSGPLGDRTYGSNISKAVVLGGV